MNISCRKLSYCIVTLSACLLLLLAGCAPHSSSPDTDTPQQAVHYPKPTEVFGVNRNKAERKRFKQMRREYLEMRHSHAPDDDWRSMDKKTKLKIRDTRQRLLFTTKQGAVSSSAMSISLEPLETGTPPVIEGEWIERGSNNQAGRMLSADIDPTDDSIYAASSGGIVWRGSLAGNDWESINDHFQFDGIRIIRVVANQSSKRIMVLDSNDFYYSDDGGRIWTAAASGFENADRWGYLKFGLVTNDSNKDIYVTALEWDYGSAYGKMTTVYKSTDSGQTFIRIFRSSGENHISLWSPYYPEGSAPVYMLVDDDFYVIHQDTTASKLSSLPLTFSSGSINTSTFNSLAGLLSNGKTYLHAAVPVSEGTGTDDGTHFYRSEDGGLTWSHQSFLGKKPFSTNSFSCSSSNPDLLYLGTNCGLVYKSSDSGLNWTNPEYGWWEYYSDPLHKLHCDIPGINVFRNADNSEYILIHTDGGTYISHDDLETVTNLSMGNLRTSQYYDTYTHRTQTDIIFAGSQDQGFQRSLPTQQTTVFDFDQLISGDDSSIVSSNGGDTIWWVYPGEMYYMKDAATSSRKYYPKFPEGMKDYLWLPPLMADPYNPDAVYLGGGRPSDSSSGAYIYHIAKDGGSFNHVQQPFKFANKISALAFSPLNSDHHYTMTSSGAFYYSTDGGDTWTRSTSPGPRSHWLFASTIVPDPIQAGKVYIGGSGYSNPGVYVSDDNGVSFQAFDSGLPDTLVSQLAISTDGRILFAATDVGPFACDTESGAWVYIGGTKAPDQSYMSVEYIPKINTARFSTYGRGIWDFNLQDKDDSKFNLPLFLPAIIGKK